MPSKLTKMTANIVALSLTQRFIKSISTGIFPAEWKFARATPIFNTWKRDTQTTIGQSIIPTVAKFSKILYTTRFIVNNLLTHCHLALHLYIVHSLH